MNFSEAQIGPHLAWSLTELDQAIELLDGQPEALEAEHDRVKREELEPLRADHGELLELTTAAYAAAVPAIQRSAFSSDDWRSTEEGVRWVTFDAEQRRIGSEIMRVEHKLAALDRASGQMRSRLHVLREQRAAKVAERDRLRKVMGPSLRGAGGVLERLRAKVGIA